jgi:hypothetical protein
MIGLVLSALLAQPLPASTTATPATEGSPASALQIEPGDAVIRNSGSTNTSGYTIVVHPDFSADVYEQGAARHATIIEPQAKWLFARLKENQPLAALGGGHCMKSASFGTTTSIAYNGTTTPDLSCPGRAATRELRRRML